jgi:hypothetical protein
MKVLLTGATGFVGSRLTERLRAAGHEVLAVSRSRAKGDFDWSEKGLESGVEACDAIVNLAGENLFAKRWNPRQKQLLWSSRVEGTTRLAALAAVHRPRCFVSASAVGWYGPHGDETLDESSPRGDDFLSELCLDWETATEAAVEAGVRTAIVRIGVVLGAGGGALQKMLPPFRLGIGGPLGNGRQWVSWVHLDDLADLIRFLIENDGAQGVFNATAPNPVTMKQLAATLGRVLHRPTLFAVPAPVLKVALGEVSSILLTGQRVLPRRAEAAGFRFRHPELAAALADVLGRELQPTG